MNLEHGTVSFQDGGWVQTGDARVSSKTSFNLLGGYVEFDMDTSRATPGTNTNIYTVSMTGDNCGEQCYCDIQDNGSPVCMELDILENNGNCAFSSTWHTVPGFNGGGCDAGGCAHDGSLPGGQFHVKSSWAENGDWLTYMNDQPLYVNNYEKDLLDDRQRQIVKDTMNQNGAAIESSQWQGWVPGDSCPGGGDLGSSMFSISNLRIMGRVHHGPEPTRCEPAPAPTPPAPTPPAPTPTPMDCPGGSLSACMALCPSVPTDAFQKCTTSCVESCLSDVSV